MVPRFIPLALRKYNLLFDTYLHKSRIASSVVFMKSRAEHAHDRQTILIQIGTLHPDSSPGVRVLLNYLPPGQLMQTAAFSRLQTNLHFSIG